MFNEDKLKSQQLNIDLDSVFTHAHHLTVYPSREEEKRDETHRTPITHFLKCFAYVHLLDPRHSTITKLCSYIDMSLLMKIDKRDTRF